MKKKINQKYKKNIEIMKLDLKGKYNEALTKLSKINIQVFIHCSMDKITDINLKDLDLEFFKRIGSFHVNQR